jgi:hypothetical protein
MGTAEEDLTRRDVSNRKTKAENRKEWRNVVRTVKAATKL